MSDNPETIEKIKEMLTKVLEIDDQLQGLKDERKDLIKEYVEKYSLNMKIIDEAIRIVKKDLNIDEIEKVADALSSLIK